MATQPKPEPALSVGAIVASIAALVSLLVATTSSLVVGHVEAVLGALAVAGPLVTGAVVRGKVRPVETSIDVPVATRFPGPNDF